MFEILTRNLEPLTSLLDSYNYNFESNAPCTASTQRVTVTCASQRKGQTTPKSYCSALSDRKLSNSTKRVIYTGNMKTIWVIGGPGCGKGTQSERIIKKYGVYHISSGDLLREEVASGSPRGASLQDLMSKGLFVPTDIVLDLIRERMEKAEAEGSTKTGFLIDGYPRELEQGKLFEEKVRSVDMILFFDVANETLMKRLMGRAAGGQRADDNEETIKKRIEIFNVKNGEIVEHYKDKLVTINAEGTVDAIFAEVTKALDPLFA